MSEYCEYMWAPSGHASTTLSRSIYQEDVRLDKRDKKLAIKSVRAILREMPDVDLNNCTDEYITRFLLARKYRAEQAAALIAAYQAQIAHRQDIFGNLTARDPALQRALRAGIPGVLPARDRKGRCVLVILASQWDPIAVPALSVQRAIFLVLEILIQDPRNQHSGFVAVVDWSGFSLRQGGALGAAALRNLIAALRGRFPARFKAIHFLSAPLYVQATLALVKPFLDEKTRNKIYLHGNNLSTLHEHLPTDILPAELGGTGPSFNPGLWAEPVIHSAMKEAELAALKKEKDERNDNASERLTNSPENDDKVIESRNVENYKRNEPLFEGRKQEKESFKSFGKSYRNNGDNKSVELSLIRTTSSFDSKNVNKLEEQKDRTRLIEISESKNGNEANKINSLDNRMDHLREVDDLALLELQSETNSNEFEMIPSRPGSEDSKDNSLDNRSEKILMRTGKSHTPTEEMNLIT
ncbi:clavesin-2-like isoform X1 [Polistes fuscatus]|uniref:clavesin-2-like isoform X1 n=1 Tax=Polistes fuscatus TaxID=30207 RepID=UPI001CA87E39|nr:clavesin-2-like isoform X1 [Polistes fuscatus]XP_043500560.1 clavesin-2-like isoform X1 [Polistes fuscatus]XP_043500561.1 clavesin-2-like isoform X1 [Polistes fuscatus]XP_043500562.1 clavesin-2-like isoform X1 [Polistes fuscatus]